MRKAWKDVLLMVSILMVLILPLSGGEAERVMKGESACPLIDRDGNLAFLFVNEDGGLSLARQKAPTRDYSVQPVVANRHIFSPAVKEDRYGNIWIIWREEEQGESRIFFGQLKESQVIPWGPLSRDQGFHLSPALDFDLENNLWAAWIEYSGGKFYVVVKNVAAGIAWTVNSPSTAEACSPKICADRNNHIHVFWVGRESGRDEILTSVFNGREWSPPHKLHKGSRSPHILPEVSVDHEGLPWVVWSAYDGNDYEIFAASWDGRSWSDEEKITDNQDADSFPALDFVLGDIPLVAWKKSTGASGGIFCKYKYGPGWSQEITISQSRKKYFAAPKLATRNDTIAVTWQSDGNIESECFYFGRLQEKAPGRGDTARPDFRPSAQLDETKYTAFGDSITYGYMNREACPEFGYPPRLEAILQEHYGESTVINEGFPGEITIDGLGRMDDTLSTHQAQYLLLMEGTNDVIDMRISMDTSAFNLEQMILKCLDSGVLPFISTIIPRNDWRWHWGDYYKNRIFYLNLLIRELAESLKVSLVDQFKIFFTYSDEEGGWESLLSNDNIHPNENGYQVMAETWFEGIKILPYAPVITDVQRIRDEILFYTKETNSVFWKDNPKLSEEGDFTGYKIYRSEGAGETPEFRLLTAVPRTLDNSSEYSYSDENITPSKNYTYAISIVRIDGMESPLSEPVNDLDR